MQQSRKELGSIRETHETPDNAWHLLQQQRDEDVGGTQQRRAVQALSGGDEDICHLITPARSLLHHRAGHFQRLPTQSYEAAYQPRVP